MAIYTIFFTLSNPMTTWVMKGKKIIIKTPYEIRGFYITNGYSKSQYLYEANNIILEVIVKSDKFEKNYKLKETLFPQFIQFPKPVKRRITVSLVKIKKGKKYNDVCISELKINPKPRNNCFVYGTGGNFECLEVFKNYKKQYIFPRDTLCSHSFLKRGKYIIFLQDPINSDMYLYSVINTVSGNIYKYKLRSFNDISEVECDYSIVNDRIKYTAEKGKKKSIKIKFPK